MARRATSGTTSSSRLIVIVDKNTLSKVDEIYKDSCSGESSKEMQKFCDFTKLIVAKQSNIEGKSWFPEWQAINTFEETVQIR